MTGRPENELCYFCGGKLESRMTTIPFVVDETVVIVKRVPAQVCTRCGEAIMDSDVATVVDRILKQAHQSGFEMSIITYERPESVLALA